MSEKLSIIAAFGNQKGGVMKTTLTSLFANYIHLSTEYSVLVIDADRQKTITNYRSLDKLEGHKEEDLYDLVTIPAIDVPKKIMNVLNEYDFILIDLPGNLHEPGVMECYRLVDYLFIPTNSTVADMTSTIDFIKDYNKTIIPIREKAGFPTAVLNGVFTKVNRQIGQYKFERTKADQGEQLIPFLKQDIEYNESTFGNQATTAKIYKNYKGKDYSEICVEIIDIMVKNEIPS